MTFLNPDVSQQAERAGMRESHSFFLLSVLVHLPFLCSSLILCLFKVDPVSLWSFRVRIVFPLHLRLSEPLRDHCKLKTHHEEHNCLIFYDKRWHLFHYHFFWCNILLSSMFINLLFNNKLDDDVIFTHKNTVFPNWTKFPFPVKTVWPGASFAFWNLIGS